MRRTTGLLPGGAALCTAAIISVPAFADETGDRAGPVTLEEVVVTATKRAETLQDVAVAVTAITSDQIQERGFTNYVDYVNTVPNMFVEDRGPGATQIYIRGLVAQSGSGFPVATYFGEAVTSLLTNNGGFANLRLVDIDRVEVLRGPQGTLFGANSLAGVVRVVPAAPDPKSVQASVAASGWNTAHSGSASDHVEGMVNLPLIDNKMALRLVGYQDYIAGFIDNVVTAADPIDYGGALGAPPGVLVIPGHPAFTRKDINAERIWGGRAALAWKPTDPLSIDLSFAAQSVKLGSEPGAQPAFGSYVVQRPLDLYSRGQNREEERIGQLIVNYDWSRAALTSATGYTRMKRDSAQDISFLAVSAGFGPQLWPLLDQSRGTSFTQEVRLQSRGESPWQWLIGYFYSNSDFDLGQSVPDYSCPTCLPEVLAGQDFAFQVVGIPEGIKQRQQSVFGQTSYDLTPKWTVGAGVRYLRDNVESFSPAAIGILAGGSQAASPPASGRNSITNPSGYIRYKANEDMTYYLQAARGFRSGAPNQTLAYDPNGPCAQSAKDLGIRAITDPDTLWTYELGLKSTWFSQRVAANIALFHQKWDGVQLAASLPCGFNASVNGGNASGNGAELEMTARLTDAWSANLTAAYVYNKFNSVVPNLGYEVGGRVPNTPEENGSAGLQYRFALGGRWGAYARADYVFVSNVHYLFGTGATAKPYLQGGYGSANMKLALTHDQLDVDLFARNITDKRAAEATGDPTQGGFIYMLRPREVGVELRYSFDGSHTR